MLQTFNQLTLQKVKMNLLLSNQTVNDNDIDIDHILPLAFGGTNNITNLQPLCKICHKEKTKNEKHNTKHETAI